MPNCPVCNSNSATKTLGNGGTIKWTCDACGAFELTGTANASLPEMLRMHQHTRPLLSHLLRRRDPRALGGTRPLSENEIRELVRTNNLPTPAEQCDYLIMALADKTQLGNFLPIETPEIRSLVGATSYEALRTLVRHLLDGKEVEPDGGERAFLQQNMRVKLTVRGWIRNREIREKGIESRNAFMAMQFDEPRVKRVYDKALVPGAKECGFNLAILNESQGAGLIDDQLRVRIRNCAFAVADVSTENPNVYWEAGYAEGLGKPVIYTCEEGAFKAGASHFDTNHHTTVPWNLDHLDIAKGKLVATIRATLPGKAR